MRALAVFLVLCSTSCAPSPEAPLSTFVTDTQARAKVVENVTACVVDAVCGLRLEFSDTTVFALYGSGERDTPPCTIPTDVSDAAFGLDEGQIVSVVIRDCTGMGLIVGSVESAEDSPGDGTTW